MSLFAMTDSDSFAAYSFFPNTWRARLSPFFINTSRYVVTSRTNRSSRARHGGTSASFRADPSTIQDCTPVAKELLDDLDAFERAGLVSPHSESQKFQKLLRIEGSGGRQSCLQGIEFIVLPSQLVILILKIVLVDRELSLKALILFDNLVEVVLLSGHLIPDSSNS